MLRTFVFCTREIMYILLIFLAFYIFYLYSKRNLDYWKKRDVKYEEPLPLFGGSLKQFTEKISLSGRFAKLYRQYTNEKYVGFFKGNTQGLVIRDPELIRHVLVTDFKKFHYRGANFHKDVTETLMKNLFNVDGDIWKLMRQKLTPAFSSGKLKAMFPLIIERTEKLQQIAEGMAKTGDEVDIRELMARYTTDFIGACGFGIDTDTLNEDDSDFRKLGKRIFTVTYREFIIAALKTISADLFKNLNFIAPEVNDQTIALVKQIMAQRNYTPIGRNDFIDLLLELKQKGTVVGESIEKRNPDGSYADVQLELDDLLLAAQVFIFFAAGFETSSSASSILLHLLAYHPEELARCQEDVDAVLKKHNGKLTFDAITEMKYLEMAFKECLRLYPSPAVLLRENVCKYNFPGTDLTIDPKTMIVISLEALHSDEKYFEDPQKFKPERFHPGNLSNIEKYVYMPFGLGPRACIGERMGVMQSLAGVAAILSKFSVSPSKNSIREPLIDYKSKLIQVIVGGLPLSLRHR